MVHPLTNYVYRKLEKNVPGWPGWSSSSVAHCHPGVASGDRNRGWGRWAVASGCLGPRFPCWVAASPHTLSPTTSHSRATDDTKPRAHSLTTSSIMHGSDGCSSPLNVNVGSALNHMRDLGQSNTFHSLHWTRNTWRYVVKAQVKCVGRN